MRSSYACLAVLAVVLVACGGADQSAETQSAETSATTQITSTSDTTATATDTTETSVTDTTSSTSEATTAIEPEVDNVAHATVGDAFVDAFYSFDPATLEAVLAAAQSSLPMVLFYQGWAEGGNYEVLDQMPCNTTLDPTTVECSITVRDDLMQALNLDFNVTDTFSLTIRNGAVVDVALSSNDPELAVMAFQWVSENKPELFTDGACEGFFDGGPTPGECIRAVVQGFEEYAASEDFAGP